MKHDYMTGKDCKTEWEISDEGVYILLNADMKELARIEDYVPHGVVPGDYGDYVELTIGPDGTICNWPRRQDLDVSEFFKKDE